MDSIRIQEIEEQAKQKAQSLKLPYLNLKSFPIDQDAVFKLAETDAHAGQMVIITKKSQSLKIAVLDPALPKTDAILKKLVTNGFDCSLSIVSSSSLALAWRRYELKKDSQTAPSGMQIKESELTALQGQIKGMGDLKERLTSMATTKILDILVAGALQAKASDIHFEPADKDIRLRYRLDGVLFDIVNFSQAGYPQLLSRIKLMSGLKINIHDTPQDGRFTIRQEKSDIEVRVSVLPGAYGENIVMRLLDPSTIKQKLEDLGLRPDVLTTIKKLLQKTTGCILTTGPTGSGKTTTLYAFVKSINSSDVKIITIEDPVEYHIEGISQTQVDVEAGYNFADGLRSIVRQDPDVILVGEIRDVETAEIAMQAALTGHLVFSTLHTNNAAGAIPRLIGLGVKPVTIAPAINSIMAQRLVRKLCSHCREKKKVSSEDFELINRSLASLDAIMKNLKFHKESEIYYPGKCADCNQTGYQGRVGVYELFEFSPELERLILKSPAISEIQDLAITNGMVTLLQDGLIKTVQGLTSVEEIMRVIGQ